MTETPQHLAWTRSTFCSDGTCVEVAHDQGDVLVRNSQQPDGVVRFTASEWEAFKRGVLGGEF
jgi:hypothetical protein